MRLNAILDQIQLTLASSILAVPGPINVFVMALSSIVSVDRVLSDVASVVAPTAPIWGMGDERNVGRKSKDVVRIWSFMVGDL